MYFYEGVKGLLDKSSGIDELMYFYVGLRVCNKNQSADDKPQNFFGGDKIGRFCVWVK